MLYSGSLRVEGSVVWCCSRDAYNKSRQVKSSQVHPSALRPLSARSLCLSLACLVPEKTKEQPFAGVCISANHLCQPATFPVDAFDMPFMGTTLHFSLTTVLVELR
jgi:hypothetical protein